MAPIKLLGILLILIICLKSGQAGKKRKGKTIKIHVPYYIKHIHHYKKVLVPKVHVVKHEHHHKKEHDHHHHHHDHHDHHDYDKAGYVDDTYETYYDDDTHKSFGGSRGSRGRGRGVYRASGSEQYNGWRDVDGTEYRGEDSTEEFEDYAEPTGPADIHLGPTTRYKVKSENLILPSVYRKRSRGRDPYDRSDHVAETQFIEDVVSPKITPKKVVTRIFTTEDSS